MTIYGLYGFTHGWARVLTVMSPAGAAALLEALAGAADVEVVGGSGRPIQVYEKRQGGLARLVEALEIEILSHEEWRTAKSKLGNAAQ